MEEKGLVNLVNSSMEAIKKYNHTKKEEALHEFKNQYLNGAFEEERRNLYDLMTSGKLDKNTKTSLVKIYDNLSYKILDFLYNLVLDNNNLAYSSLINIYQVSKETEKYSMNQDKKLAA